MTKSVSKLVSDISFLGQRNVLLPHAHRKRKSTTLIRRGRCRIDYWGLGWAEIEFANEVTDSIVGSGRWAHASSGDELLTVGCTAGGDCLTEQDKRICKV